MENVWKGIVKSVAAFGGAIAGAMGEWDATLKVLVVMMIVDYLSGLMAAAMGWSDKTEYGGLSSKAGFLGLGKKGLMLAVVWMATMLDAAMGTEMCRDAACWFYIANEGISILENAGLAGAPYPAKLKELLGQKQKEDARDEFHA